MVSFQVKFKIHSSTTKNSTKRYSEFNEFKVSQFTEFL